MNSIFYCNFYEFYKNNKYINHTKKKKLIFKSNINLIHISHNFGKGNYFLLSNLYKEKGFKLKYSFGFDGDSKHI